MSAIIGADAAKLAGLQIDLLQKVRQGHITLDHMEWYAGLTKEARDTLMAGKSVPLPEPTQKFTLLVDLGVITVPDDYDHATHLASFLKKNREEFYGVNDNITDANFPNPSRILKHGDKLWVRAFHQVIGGTTTSGERMTFLATQKAIHTGTQGVSLVWEQKRDQLPKGKWYASFDEEDRLWQNADGYLRVPSVHAYSDGGFNFFLSDFEGVWDDYDAFLCFCDLPA